NRPAPRSRAWAASPPARGPPGRPAPWRTRRRAPPRNELASLPPFEAGPGRPGRSRVPGRRPVSRRSLRSDVEPNALAIEVRQERLRREHVFGRVDARRDPAVRQPSGGDGDGDRGAERAAPDPLRLGLEPRSPQEPCGRAV